MVTASFNPDLRDENLVAPLPARISLNQTTSSCTTTPLIKTERSIHSARRVQVGGGSASTMKKDIVRLSFIMATLFEKILRARFPLIASPVAIAGTFPRYFPRREGIPVIPTRGVQRLAALNPQEQGALMEGVTRVQTILGTPFKPRTLRFAFMMDRSPVRKFPMSCHVIPGRPAMAVVR